MGKDYRELAARYALIQKNSSFSIKKEQVIHEESRIYDGIFRGRGEINPYEVRKQITDTMDSKAHVFRSENDLVKAIKIYEN